MNPFARTVFAVFLTLFSTSSYAQILNPVTWQVALSKTEVKVGDEIEVVFKATVDPLWYIYAQDLEPDCGPLLTQARFNEATNIQAVAKLRAINPKPKHDQIFGCDVKVLEGKGELRQRIKITGNPVV